MTENDPHNLTIRLELEAHHDPSEPANPISTPIKNIQHNSDTDSTELLTKTRLSKNNKIIIFGCSSVIVVVIVVIVIFFPSIFGLQPEIPKESISVPFANVTQITSINEAYSLSDNCPWGFSHQGIDFFGDTGTIFTSSIDGTIKRKELVYTEDKVYQVRLFIGYNNSMEVGIGYNFEPFSGNEADGNDQWDRVIVEVGDNVSQNQKIGTLLHIGSGAHIQYIHTTIHFLAGI